MIKSDTIELVSAAFVKAQSEMGNATKDSSNPFFKSKYADLNAIREAIMPALANNNLCVAQPMVVIDGINYIETLIIHTSGQYFGGLTEVVHPKKDDAQNFGAGTTYARRFGLQSLVCVGSEDDDGNGVMSRAPSKPYVANTPTKQFTPPANVKAEIEAAEKPKTGFGLKKEVTKSVVKTEDSEEWS